MCYRDNLNFSLKKLKCADASEVTTAVILEVINEGPFNLIFKKYPHHTETARQCGVLLFNHLPLSPLRITEVLDPVADP